MDTVGRFSREFITDVNTRYHDAVVASYDTRLEQNHPAVIDWYRSLFERHVFPHLDCTAQPTCLDFGCGSGFLEQFVSGRKITVTGIDVSAKMIERAAARYPAVRYRQADLYTYDSPEQFDLTMENAVLHHLLEYEPLIDKMASLTKRGGVLFIGNEPNRFAYRCLAALKPFFRKTVNRQRTHTAAQLLGDQQLEALSEYHLFYGSGISPYGVKSKLLSLGFRKVLLFFSLRELLATIEEAYPSVKLNRLLPGPIRDHFLLSRNFSVIAYK